MDAGKAKWRMMEWIGETRKEKIGERRGMGGDDRKGKLEWEWVLERLGTGMGRKGEAEKWSLGLAEEETMNLLVTPVTFTLPRSSLGMARLNHLHQDHQHHPLGFTRLY